MIPPALTYVTTISAFVSPALEIGAIATGRRRIIPITGGTVKGDRINGTIGAGFNDYQLVRNDNVAEIQARYIIDTHDGAKIYVENNGIRHAAPDIVEKLIKGEPVDPALVYFRAVPKLECSDPRYEWVNRSLFICTGIRHPDCVELTFWRVE
jgi:hypothetical protein